MSNTAHGKFGGLNHQTSINEDGDDGQTEGGQAPTGHVDEVYNELI